VVGFRELGLVNAFTLEASFCGAAAGSRHAGHHFNAGHLEEMGAAVVRGFYGRGSCGHREPYTSSPAGRSSTILRRRIGHHLRLHDQELGCSWASK
jgi:hypothetical protein